MDKSNLTHEELVKLLDKVRVGQIYSCIEDNRVVMVSMVKPKEILGYIFTGFEVSPYYCLAPMDFVRYFRLIYDPREKK
jgi:hypothetical protein